MARRNSSKLILNYFYATRLQVAIVADRNNLDSVLVLCVSLKIASIQLVLRAIKLLPIKPVLAFLSYLIRQ